MAEGRLDRAVFEALPPSTHVLDVKDHGKSEWTSTSCISIICDGVTQRYFLKSAKGETGRTMLQGEFAATNQVFKAMPDFIPMPYTWGQLKDSPESWFFLCQYKDMDLGTPDADIFTSRLAELHCRGISENGMFGFSVPTCDGAVPHNVEWQKDWGTFYANMLKTVAQYDAEANGHWKELDSILQKLISHVIPRILGKLDIKPCLIHGDMYEGNIGTDRETGKVMIFDASSFYAHNEMELGLWRWSDTMSTFTESYLRHFPPTEPAEEWDDRNRIYSLKSKINFSADHPGEDGKKMRQVVSDDISYLCDKYA